jgi:NAD(P)-dependent dehydrogenase (short-subunit alcohol dehydrogenase family)
MTDFSGRVVIVTGAAGGIGEITAHTFARAGAQVVLLDRDRKRLPEVVEAIAATGLHAQGHVVDLCEEEQVRSVLTAVVEDYGRIDVVDNNAAALELSAQDDPDLAGLACHDLVNIFKADVLPGFLMTKHVLPTMLSQRSGSVINIASVTGMAGEIGLTAYGMAKAAIIQMTRATAVQYSKQGIRCNAISPAYVTTPNNEIYAPKGLQEIYERNMLTPRVTAPQDVANAALFLGSDESAMITGQVLAVDGGLGAASPIVADQRDSQLSKI